MNTMPATAVRFGPYDYPVRHIWRDGAAFGGREGAEPVNLANVWSYKYDTTTSLGLHGAVELLDILMYPDFLLYKGELGLKNDHGALLTLNTTFLMLDSFLSTVRARLLPSNASAWTVFRFATGWTECIIT
ncbi:hypothetical protein V7S43_012218 [Phytophthora oleae]|uniref:Uncharacterized protein n=1 Tax=Phytophthora oleae TaxID=2107226 RepID=A0ABD3F8P0_9STRA